MTDHNARQAGLISTMIDEWYFHADEHVKAKLADYSNVLLDRFAAHSADARNGEGVALTDEQIHQLWLSTPNGENLREDVIIFARALLASNSGTVQRMMKRLAQLLDDDKFGEMEAIVASAGIQPPDIAAPAAPASEPAGWKLVPVRSTPEIQSAISSALFDQQVDHNLIRKLDMADIYAAIIDEAAAAPAPAPAAQDDGIRWDLFPSWLIDHCEGDTITEEGLQRALADMLKAYPVQQSATPAEPVPSQATEPPLLGHWHGGNGVLCCGTLRVFGEDFDTDPSEEFKQEIMQWVCDTLNAALVPADAASEADKK